MEEDKKYQENQQIQEEIPCEMEQQNYDFDMQFQVSNSYTVSDSKVSFPRKGIVIRKDGASTQEKQIKINTSCIKEGRIIGKGSAGLVYEGEYQLNGQIVKVAIKQISLYSQKNVRQQFFNDLRVFLNSCDENLVKFYGCYYQKGYLTQVIQYMDMGSLRNLIDHFSAKTHNKYLIEPVLAHFCKCILKGLLAIHQRRQIHRDIKPQNILLNSKGEVKITDFGVSKTLDKTFGIAKTPTGTMTYMSPQRLKTDGHTYNCDVWSFGLVLYELATLRNTPYVQRPDQVQLAMIKRVRDSAPPQFLPEDNRSPEMKHFLSRCLEKDYKYRANVQELINHKWMKVQLSQLPEQHFKIYMRNISKQMKIES